MTTHLRLRWAVLAVAAAALTLSACNPMSPSNDRRSLSSARTLTEFVNQIKSKYGYSFPDANLYDHPFEDFPASFALYGSDPFNGTWSSRPTATYPFENGRFNFGPKDGNRKASYGAIDFTNGLQAEGQFQAFWGVRDFNPQSSTSIPYSQIIVITEGIVTSAGVQKYRIIQSLYGSIVNEPVRFNGTSFVVTPTSFAVRGSYQAINVETIDKNDPGVPCLFNACGLNYDSIWVKL